MHSENGLMRHSEVKQLIEAVRAGSDAAFSELLGLYEPLFVSMISRYSAEYDASDDKDEVHQDLRVAFYNAILKYEVGVLTA